MPRYEYSCSACGKTFEVNQRMSDPPLTECACGGKGTVKRLMSAGSGLIFKGSGFYITDYKNGGSGSASSPATAGAAGKAGDSKSGRARPRPRRRLRQLPRRAAAAVAVATAAAGDAGRGAAARVDRGGTCRFLLTAGASGGLFFAPGLVTRRRGVCRFSGWVAERLMALASKASLGLYPNVGSNPTPTAIFFFRTALVSFGRGFRGVRGFVQGMGNGDWG